MQDTQTQGTMKLYQLVEVRRAARPATLQPGRYVMADKEGVALAVEVDDATQLGAIADQLEGGARWLARAAWFRPSSQEVANA